MPRALPEHPVIRRHALRNAMLPTITVLALDVGFLVGDFAVVETVFAYPGFGRLTVFAIQQRDLPLIQACALLLAGADCLATVAADLLYAYLIRGSATGGGRHVSVSLRGAEAAVARAPDRDLRSRVARGGLASGGSRRRSSPAGSSSCSSWPWPSARTGSRPTPTTRCTTGTSRRRPAGSLPRAPTSTGAMSEPRPRRRSHVALLRAGQHGAQSAPRRPAGPVGRVQADGRTRR